MVQHFRIGLASQRVTRIMLSTLASVSLMVATGCPTQPAPAPRSATPASAESAEPAVQPRELLGTWWGKAWQVAPGGPWQDAETAGFSLAMADSSPGTVRTDEPASEEQLSEYPSVTVELTVAEEHLAVSGIEGALVRITYDEPGADEADQTSQAVLFKHAPDGALVLDCGRDQLQVVSVEADRVELGGQLRGTSVASLSLTRQPDTAGTDTSRQ